MEPKETYNRVGIVKNYGRYRVERSDVQQYTCPDPYYSGGICVDKSGDDQGRHFIRHRPSLDPIQDRLCDEDPEGESCIIVTYNGTIYEGKIRITGKTNLPNGFTIYDRSSD